MLLIHAEKGFAECQCLFARFRQRIGNFIDWIGGIIHSGFQDAERYSRFFRALARICHLANDSHCVFAEPLHDALHIFNGPAKIAVYNFSGKLAILCYPLEILRNFAERPFNLMRLGCHGHGLRSEVGEGLAGIFDGHIELGDQHIHRVVFADGTIQYLSGGFLFLRKVCCGFGKGIGFFFRRHLRIGQCIPCGL